jgi:hypothetical protein
VPRCQVSPPFGEITVRAGAAGVRVKLLLLVSLRAGWLVLWTLTLKSLPVLPVNDIGQVYDPVPPLPADVLPTIVPTSAPPFSSIIFTIEPGSPV